MSAHIGERVDERPMHNLTSDVATKVAPCTMQDLLAQHRATLDRLQGVLEELTGRLGPILLPADSDVPTSTSPSAQSDMGMAIVEVTSRVEYLTGCVGNILNRVQL